MTIQGKLNTSLIVLTIIIKMKQILLSLIMLFSVYIALGQNSFSAKLNIPNEIVQGVYTDITLDIYKPDGARNYTVFTQELPDGFFVKIIDVQGATHLYENNKLTLTWMRSPVNAKISVKYQISSMVGVTGKFNVSGKLSYMAGSKQGVFDLNKYTLNIVEKKTIVLTPENTEKNTHLYPILNTKLEGISCKRTVIYNKNKNSYDVEIQLIKSNNGGTYSITEKIPKNYEFSEIDSQEAKIKSQSGLVQFLWVNPANDKNLKVQYKLTPKDSIIEEPKIRGKLSFLKNGQILNMPITNQE